MERTIPRMVGESSCRTLWCSLRSPSASTVRFWRSERPMALLEYVISSRRAIVLSSFRRAYAHLVAGLRCPPPGQLFDCEATALGQVLGCAQLLQTRHGGLDDVGIVTS